MNPKLPEAVEIFKSLGWEKATFENILELPTGTKDEKKIAKEGLAKGEWGGWRQSSTPNSYGYFDTKWQNNTDVNLELLAAFAIHVGVDAPRAANIFANIGQQAQRQQSMTENIEKLIIEVIVARGEKFATRFVTSCLRPNTIWSLWRYRRILILLVDRLNLDIPENIEYINFWAEFAYDSYVKGIQSNNIAIIPVEKIENRFVEHIKKGVAIRVQAVGNFRELFLAGVERGLLARDEAILEIFSGMDLAARPIDRKEWMFMLNSLEVTDEELVKHAQVLIPMLSLADGAITTKLAPVLIKGVEDDLITEVLLGAFSCTAKKTRKMVLKLALERDKPKDVDVEELIPWLTILLSDNDKSIVTPTTKLVAKWGIEIESEDIETGENELLGLWQETPHVWQVPDFEIGEITSEALTELASTLVNRTTVVNDIYVEQFYAVANALACKDPEETRASLRGLRHDWTGAWSSLINWVNKYDMQGDINATWNPWNSRPHIESRNIAICMNLGKLPCLLSTPSKLDMSITVPDLISRLEMYKKANINALEPDFQLALTRLDVNSKTDSCVEKLEKLDVTVELLKKKPLALTKSMPSNAGKMILAYLDDPITDEHLIIKKRNDYDVIEYITPPNSLKQFPKRFKGYSYGLFLVLPNLGDNSLRGIIWHESSDNKPLGLNLRQVARRAKPLPPGGSINFLAAQRAVKSLEVAEDSILAVTEAWQRGLLRPNVADVTLLDWSKDPPKNLVAFAQALESVAREGILSVVWPILDDIIKISLKEPRMLTGTAEFAEVILTLLPEVQHAIEKGLVDSTALDLPGIRRLAKRKGTSNAVATAKKIVELLPPSPDSSAPISEMEEELISTPMLDLPFNEVWVESTKVPFNIDDAELRINLREVNTNKKTAIYFTITLPNEPFLFQVSHGFYNLNSYGQCVVDAFDSETTTWTNDISNRHVLYWDEKKKAMIAEKSTNPRRSNTQKYALSSSLITIVIAVVADDYDNYYIRALLGRSINDGQINAEAVRHAMQTILKYIDIINPAKLMRLIEKVSKWLPVFWPVLTECVKHVGESMKTGEKPPTWINRILDNTIRFAPYLAEAAKQGLIPAADAQWIGLSDIANSKAKSKAVEKAKMLMKLLGK